MGRGRKSSDRLRVKSAASKGSQSSEDDSNKLSYFCQTTPLHGFQSITTSNQKWKKTIWGTFIVLSCALGTYQIIKVIVEYHKLNTAFSVSMVRPDMLKFPDVMICDSNPNNFSQYKHLGLANRQNTSLTTLIHRFSIEWDFESIVKFVKNPKKGRHIKHALELLPKLQNETGMDFRRLVLSFGHNSARLFTFCTMGKIGADGKPLKVSCSDIAEPLVYHKYGVCYVIRGNKQSKDEVVFGSFGALLNVHVRLNRDAYSPRNYRPEGIYIGVAYRYESEFDSQLLSAIPATFTMIHLKPKMVENLDHPRARCREGVVETKLACHKRCEMKAFLSKCNCAPIIFYHLSRENRTCEVAETIACVEKHADWLRENTTRCKETVCRVPCIQWEYMTTESDMTYYISENATPTEQEWKFKTNIQLFMTNLEYNKFKQFYTMTFDTLLGAIGGLFGIYLGGSMLAILHCLFTFFEVLGKKFKPENVESAIRSATEIHFVPYAASATSGADSRFKHNCEPGGTAIGMKPEYTNLHNGYGSNQPISTYVEVDV